MTLAGVACADQERAARDPSGLVLALPAEWVDTSLERGTSWSGPRGTSAWRTTVNVHVVPVRTDEVSRSPESVARAVAVQARHMEGASARVSQGPKVAGAASWRVELRFDRGDTRYRRLQYVLQRGGDIVSLDGTAPQATWAELEPVLARAVETARWEDE